MFYPEKTFISTGCKQNFYTLRKWGVLRDNRGVTRNTSLYVQNLSTDKDKALLKGKEISRKLGLPFDPEIDFDLKEIERREGSETFQYVEPDDEDIQEDVYASEYEKICATLPESTTERQKEAIRAICEGENIFLNGPGGVGKSFVINKVYNSETLVCAPSGIAALNVGGMTCHRAFGLPLNVDLPKNYYDSLPDSTQAFLKCSKKPRIIIDEISMLRADLLHLIDKKLQRFMRKEEPFGGVQVVVVGDFLQIPPIVNSSDRDEYYHGQGYTSRYCFSSPSWNFRMIALTEVIRQEDRTQVAMLNAIRRNTKQAPAALRAITANAKPYEANSDIHLCTTNGRARDINDREYGKMGSRERVFFARYTGRWSESERPVDECLRLKEGCRVIIVQNHPSGLYTNGDRGVITSIQGSDVRVLKDSGEEVLIEKGKWERFKYERKGDHVEPVIEATYEQLPLKLGWAISIHKSQGMTLDCASIDVARGCFEHGQLYVALSRVRDLKNLSFVTHVDTSNIIVDQEVLDFYRKTVREGKSE